MTDQPAALPDGPSDGMTPAGLTVREASVRASVSERQVRRWLADGSIRAEKRDGRWRIDADAFGTFLRARRERAIPAARPAARPSARTRLAEVEAEAGRLRERLEERREEVQWLRRRLEEAEETIQRLALPAAREPEATSPSAPVEPDRPRRSWWARLWGREK